MIQPVGHDVNFNLSISNSCNDCCEDDKCSCCCLKKTPKPSPANLAVQQVASSAMAGDEEKKEDIAPEFKQRKHKYKCCVIM